MGELVPWVMWTWVGLEGSQIGTLSKFQGPAQFELPVGPGWSMVLLLQPDFLKAMSSLAFFCSCHTYELSSPAATPFHWDGFVAVTDALPAGSQWSFLIQCGLSICHWGPLPSGFLIFFFPPQTVPSCSVHELSFSSSKPLDGSITLGLSLALPQTVIEILLITYSVPFIAQLVKNLPAMQETWVRFLGWEDSLEKEMATLSNTLAWRIPWTEEPGRLLSIGSQESDMT